jgi:hypothetical protein
VWVELAIATGSVVIGIIGSVALSIKQTGESRIQMTQINNFLVDWRAEMANRFARMDAVQTEILSRMRQR